MVVGFLLMLLALVALWAARSEVDGAARFQGGKRVGLFAGGGLLFVLGALLCVGRLMEWSQAVGGL